jgi:hypothetical protein
MNRPRRPSRLVLVLLLLPLVLEVGLRVAAHLTHRERGMEFHADFGWRPVPGVQKRGRYWGGEQLAWTNERGWRDESMPFERTPGVHRLVALGDSFTFGVQVDFGERFSERLEQIVPALEVLNLGVTGYGTDQELRVLEVEGLRYAPDTVLVVAFLSNDLNDIQLSRNLSWPKPWYERVGDGLRLHPPLPDLAVHLRSASYLAELAARGIERGHPHWERAPGSPLPRPHELFLALIGRMRGICSQRGLRLLVVTAFAQNRHGEGLPESELLARDGLVKAGIEVIDTLDLLREDAHYAPDGHWSPAGHEVLARAIAERLQTDSGGERVPAAVSGDRDG